MKKLAYLTAALLMTTTSASFAEQQIFYCNNTMAKAVMAEIAVEKQGNKMAIQVNIGGDVTKHIIPASGIIDVYKNGSVIVDMGKKKMYASGNEYCSIENQPQQPNTQQQQQQKKEPPYQGPFFDGFK